MFRVRKIEVFFQPATSYAFLYWYNLADLYSLWRGVWRGSKRGLKWQSGQFEWRANKPLLPSVHSSKYTTKYAPLNPKGCEICTKYNWKYAQFWEHFNVSTLECSMHTSKYEHFEVCMLQSAPTFKYAHFEACFEVHTHLNCTFFLHFFCQRVPLIATHWVKVWFSPHSNTDAGLSWATYIHTTIFGLTCRTKNTNNDQSAWCFNMSPCWANGRDF